MSRQTCWPVVLCCLLIQRCGGWLGRESSEVGHRLNKGCAMEWRSRAEWVPTRTTTELSSPSKVGTFLPVLCLVSFFPVPPWINCADDSCRRVHLDFGSYKYRSRYLLIYSLHRVWARIASCCQPNLEARSLEAFDRKMIYNAFHMPYPKKKNLFHFKGPTGGKKRGMMQDQSHHDSWASLKLSHITKLSRYYITR